MQIYGLRLFPRICCTLAASLLLTLLFSAVVFSQEATQTAPWAYKLQFENEWVRVIRVHYEPALLVVLSAGRLRTKSAAKPTTLAPGQTIWVASDRQERFENLGDAPMELLRFDLKTARLEPKEGQKKSGK